MGMVATEYEFKDSDCFADSGKVVLNLITLLSVDNIFVMLGYFVRAGLQ